MAIKTAKQRRLFQQQTQFQQPNAVSFITYIKGLATQLSLLLTQSTLG